MTAVIEHVADVNAATLTAALLDDFLASLKARLFGKAFPFPGSPILRLPGS